MFMTFKEADDLGPFDEKPVLSANVDPQLHMSRAEGDLPFYLICAKDTTLVIMSGKARVCFAQGGVRWFDALPGDFVYVPAGMPHTIKTVVPGVLYRYKARKPGLEAVAWRCPPCDSEVHRVTWSSDAEISQAAYAKALDAFNADVSLRTCRACGTVHPPVSFDASRWRELAISLVNEKEH